MFLIKWNNTHAVSASEVSSYIGSFIKQEFKDDTISHSLVHLIKLLEVCGGLCFVRLDLRT